MDGYLLHPPMLLSDWREDSRPLLIVDLESWPPDVAIDPLPPVPILAVGDPTHPCAPSVDVVIDVVLRLELLVDRISARPRTSAVVAGLLRALDGLPAERALPLESHAFAMLQAGEEHAEWMSRRRPARRIGPGHLHVSRQGSALDLCMARPHARNMIDRDMRDALYDAFLLAALDREISHVRLHSTGPCFSMGADLGEFGTTRDPVLADAIRVRTLPAYPMSQRAEIFEVHVQGACVGSGLELAALAGTLTASGDAWFQLPEVSMGILPGFGGCVSIPRRIGRQRAAGLMLSGKRISARTALDWNLIDRIVVDRPADERCDDARIA